MQSSDTSLPLRFQPLVIASLHGNGRREDRIYVGIESANGVARDDDRDE
jgi:hypothetical protein